MKPIISSFMFSDETQNVQTQPQSASLHLINPLNVIRPHFVPGSYTFAMSFGILRLLLTQSHNLQIIMKSPSGKISLDTGVIYISQPAPVEDDLPLEAHGMMFNFNFRNVPFEENGEYLTTIIIDEQEIGEYPLFVYQQRR